MPTTPSYDAAAKSVRGLSQYRRQASEAGRSTFTEAIALAQVQATLAVAEALHALNQPGAARTGTTAVDTGQV